METLQSFASVPNGISNTSAVRRRGKNFKNCNLNAEDHDQASKLLGAVFSDVRFRTPDYSWFFSEHTQPSTIPCKSLTWFVCQETIAHHDWCKWFYRLDLFICFRVLFANQSLQASQTDKLTNCEVIGLQVVWIGDAPIVDSSFPKLILNPQEYPHGFLKPCRNVCIWFLHYCRSNPWFDGLDHVESCYIWWGASSCWLVNQLKTLFTTHMICFFFLDPSFI